MELYKYFPKASDRMGFLWTLTTIEDVYIIEYGPAGTTHFAIEGVMGLNAEHKSNTYTTHIDETDIAFGGTERLEKSILEIDGIHSPKVIFIMASSVSSIIGTDIESVVYEMKDKVNALLIPVTTGGFKGDYTKGIEDALLVIANNLVKSSKNKTNTFNIIGSNLDSFNFLSDVEEMKTMVKKAFDYDVNTVFTAYSSLQEIENASEAKFNIVLRQEGIKCAEFLKEKFNQPYICIRPYSTTDIIEGLNGLANLIEQSPNASYLKEINTLSQKVLMYFRGLTRTLSRKNVVISGDVDTVLGLANYVEEIGLEIDNLIINHSLKRKQKKALLELWGDKLIIDPNEEDKENIIINSNPFLLLGDGNALEMTNDIESIIKIQVSNPNFNKTLFYKYSPFVGINGFVNLSEIIINKIREKH